eukprot:2916879-Alexandrium_andersonii.AAC.1
MGRWPASRLTLQSGIEDTQVHKVGVQCSSDFRCVKCLIPATPDLRSFAFNFGKCGIATHVRTWNCAGPGMASTSIPEATEGRIKRRRRLRGVA